MIEPAGEEALFWAGAAVATTLRVVELAAIAVAAVFIAPPLVILAVIVVVAFIAAAAVVAVVALPVVAVRRVHRHRSEHPHRLVRLMVARAHRKQYE